MLLEAITWERLTDAVVDQTTRTSAEKSGPWFCIGLDGSFDAGVGDLAARVGDALRLRGRSVLAVSTAGFLRPASLRYEYGRTDPDAYYNGWFDTGALWREVFGPLETGGSGLVLPDLWDPSRDRATRSPRVALPEGGVLLLYGPFLLGHWFPFDLTLHLRLSPGALARRTAAAERWTLPAFQRYEEEVGPVESADAVVSVDDLRHPAWSGFGGDF
ncbi:uridine kinase [Streptomyces albipurpureus]|uniref:Uridine kinase n=1 Tax=Streptomyces albipurpureus TaxID=2897419 RepID=A0ABT0UQF8_9ACTN|nr:uridine kinase [Streptomyces sp. CWNU-1]MCM2390832.1 uridine kinase [Streptomyces sp. CWNU-1]